MTQDTQSQGDAFTVIGRLRPRAGSHNLETDVICLAHGEVSAKRPDDADLTQADADDPDLRDDGGMRCDLCNVVLVPALTTDEIAERLAAAMTDEA